MEQCARSFRIDLHRLSHLPCIEWAIFESGEQIELHPRKHCERGIDRSCQGFDRRRTRRPLVHVRTLLASGDGLRSSRTYAASFLSRRWIEQSFALDVGVSNDTMPSRNFGLDLNSKVVGCIAHGVEAESH